MKNIKPFGPSIVKFSITKELINELNKYTDNIINDHNKAKDLDHGHNLVGQVTQEILLGKDFMKRMVC